MYQYHHLQHHCSIVSSTSRIILSNWSATILLGLLCTLINLAVACVIHYTLSPCLTYLSQWPPPPRPTPVIVPSHLTSNPAPDTSNAAAESSTPSAPNTYSGKAITEVRTTKGRASRSSLHRAVLEKLEVQRAIEDLKGQGEGG